MAAITAPPTIETIPRIAQYTGLKSWLTTIDHKRIGLLYGTSAFILFLVAGLEAILMRIQLMYPNGKVISAETFNQMFTMHGTTMVFMVIMPLSAAFFNYIVPLQIGARDVAFPRLNALSYWVFLGGTLVMHAGFFVGAAPDGGWYMYTPLTGPDYSPGANQNFWIIGLQLLGVASIMAGLNFFVTIVNMRCPGMRMMRLPVFSWMTLITVVLILLAFPVITVAVTQLMFDRFFDTAFYNVQKGGQPILWQHLFWILGHPEVYILILPAFGIVSEILPVFSRKPLFGYHVVVYSGMSIAFLGFGVWGHHMFTEGMGPIADAFFAVATMIIAVPTGVKVLNWIATMWFGQIKLNVIMAFMFGFIILFTMGGISGIMHASPPLDAHHQDSYFVVAHFHYVLFGGSIFGLVAGMYYWWPKYTGRVLDEKLGWWHFWLMLIGMNLTFFPMHFVGIWGMPRRIYTYASDMGWNEINWMVSIGSYILVASFVVFLINVYQTLRKPPSNPADPWDGATLEWAIPSPPPIYNFETVPAVRGRDAWWTMKRSGKPPTLAVRESLHMTQADGYVEAYRKHIHLPNPSWYPIMIAGSMTFAGASFLLVGGTALFWPLFLIGVLGIFVTTYGIVLEPSS